MDWKRLHAKENLAPYFSLNTRMTFSNSETVLGASRPHSSSQSVRMTGAEVGVVPAAVLTEEAESIILTLVRLHRAVIGRIALQEA